MDIATNISEVARKSPTTKSPTANAAVFAGELDGEFVEASFLIFGLGDSLFGVPALMVREVHALPQLSPLQETAPFIVGVMNLRGTIVPVMDLNARFGRACEPYRLDDSVVVLSWDDAEVAIIVNQVNAVQRIAATQVEPPPHHGRAHDLALPFVAGVTQIESGIVMLLHLPHLLNWRAPAENGENSSRQVLAVRPFESQAWTPAERAILEKRQARLRAESESDVDNKESAPIAVIALGGEEFGVELSVLREFVAVNTVAPVPCCPPHILGQINLRGDIVTLIDVRAALGLAFTETASLSTIGVARQVLAGQNAEQAAASLTIAVVQYEEASIGIVIDSVRDVLYLHESERHVLDASLQNSGGRGKFFDGGTLYHGRLLPLLAIEQLFAEGHLEVDEMA